MTVSTTNISDAAIGNGSDKVFYFTFRCSSADLVKAYVSGVAATPTVLVNADQVASPGGRVTFATAPASGTVVLIRRETPLTQEIDLQAYDRFPAEVVEGGFDRLTLEIQEEKGGREEGEELLHAELEAEADARVAGDLAEAAARSAAILAILRSGAAPANVQDALVISTGSTEPRSLADRFASQANVLDFGADPTGVQNSTTAILAAIQSLRANATSILDTIGGDTITAYSSGVVVFPRGVFVISPDALRISQDLGLILRGSGSRRTNNAVHGGTTILIRGTSSGYGIQAYRSGGRGLTIEDLDLCYESSGFTGDVLDVYDCPGVTLNRVFLGTYGTSGGTRLQTARSCIRATYDEFFTARNCVFDGAVDGWWSDDVRAFDGNTFGGSVTSFDACVWYDFEGQMVRQDGNRTRSDLKFDSCVFNTINVSPARSVDLTNVDGLTLISCGFGGSTGTVPSEEWFRLINVTGVVLGCSFDDLAAAGTLLGMVHFAGNRIYCTDGVFLTGGVITGHSNEFGKGTNGFVLSPAAPLCVKLGPDYFKPAVTTSYYVPLDSVDLSGRIDYDLPNDTSASKFSNASARIQVRNVDEKMITIDAAGTTALNVYDTGRSLIASGSSPQTFTLPTPQPGTRLTIRKVGSSTLAVNCAGGTNFYTGSGAAKTAASCAAPDVGGTLDLLAYGAVGWFVQANGTWTFT